MFVITRNGRGVAAFAMCVVSLQPRWACQLLDYDQLKCGNIMSYVRDKGQLFKAGLPLIIL
jgi:hypothetical protein